MGRRGVELFKEQKYAKLRKHHQDLGVPWTDPTFPANLCSLGLAKARTLHQVEWCRLQELCENPRLVSGQQVGEHEVVQGRGGNSWFVAAASVLGGVPSLWERVVPKYKDQEEGEYSGVFR